jgi:hypothetical protein
MYQFAIEISQDGRSWEEVDRSVGTSPKEKGQLLRLNAEGYPAFEVRARRVKADNVVWEVVQGQRCWLKAAKRAEAVAFFKLLGGRKTHKGLEIAARRSDWASLEVSLWPARLAAAGGPTAERETTAEFEKRLNEAQQQQGGADV